MPPSVQVIIQHTMTSEGAPQIQIQSNLVPEPGVWLTISAILMDALRLAIEADVREQTPRQDRVIQVPTIMLPGGRV